MASDDSTVALFEEGDRLEHDDHGKLTIDSVIERPVGMGRDGAIYEYTIRFTPDSARKTIFERVEQTQPWQEFKKGLDWDDNGGVQG